MNFYSFKDPDAQVFRVNGQFFRKIHRNFVEEFTDFVDSGLYQELIDQKLIIPHQEIQSDLNSYEFPLLIKPKQLIYHVLPFEWSEQMWFECNRTCLQINIIALKFGFILKDATPYNYTYYEGKMCMFDSSSFIRFNEGNPWFAYRQYCEEMLGPYLLIKYKGAEWSKFGISSLRGYNLKFIASHLPFRSKFNLLALIHIHLHKNFSNNQLALDKKNENKSVFTIKTFQSFLESIYLNFSESLTKRLGHWQRYYKDFLESDGYLIAKKEIITDWITNLGVKSITDLGANVGEFSFLASSMVERVLAIEADPTCVDEIINHISAKEIKNVYPAMMDLTQVSPDLGNNLAEYTNIFSRGKSEMVFALALVHHLAISYSFSFNHIFTLLSQFTSRYLIVEFIDKSDEKVQILLQNKRNNFEWYDCENFENSCKIYFNIFEKVVIPNSKRILYLVEKINDINSTQNN